MKKVDEIGCAAYGLIEKVRAHINNVNEFENDIPAKLREAKARRADAFAAFAEKVEEMLPSLDAFAESKEISDEDAGTFFSKLKDLVVAAGEVAASSDTVRALGVLHESTFNMVERGPDAIRTSLKFARAAIADLENDGAFKTAGD